MKKHILCIDALFNSSSECKYNDFSFVRILISSGPTYESSRQGINNFVINDMLTYYSIDWSDDLKKATKTGTKERPRERNERKYVVIGLLMHNFNSAWNK